MTQDKIKHYIGAELFNHISSLNRLQLEKMKRDIIHDMNNARLEPTTLFKRTIELTYIKQRLN